MKFKHDICIIGGVGHVGLPLGLAFAKEKKKVLLLDIDKKNMNLVKNRIMPFKEEGANELLKKHFSKISISSEFNLIKSCKFIVVCIGTPINKKLRPELRKFINLFVKLKKYTNDDQFIIVRSSVYPGTMEKIYKITKKFKNITYCPERIVQGSALVELPKLTQIVSGYSSGAIKESSKLFKKISKDILVCNVKEAELIKLFSNAYRYINFSISNQFYMMSKDLNIDYKVLRKKMMLGYDRNSNLPKAGFAAGPCLLKDTMQLSGFFNHKFTLGLSAMKINEGLPMYLLNQVKKNKNYKKKIIGVLGLAFKADTDDIRDSLSIKLLKLLKKNKIKFFQSDEYYNNSNNISAKQLIKKSDIIIVGVMHKSYKNLKIPKNKTIINIW